MILSTPCLILFCLFHLSIAQKLCIARKMWSVIDKACVDCFSVSNNHCVRCDVTNICSQCITGYAPDNKGACTQVCTLDGCKTCKSTVKCENCNLGFYLDGDICKKCITGCLSCSSDTVCDICKSGYLEAADRTCLICPANCKTCETAQKCLACDSGYYLNKAFACSACPQKCKTCLVANPNFCEVCIAGYLSVEGICTECQEKKSLHCKYCGGSHCFLCDPGFFPNIVGNCIKCSPNCDACSYQRCFHCADNYTLNNYGFCEACGPKSSSGCKSCLNKGICTECNLNYVLNSETSLCIVCPLGCKKCDLNSQCQTCNDGYILEKKKCVVCKPDSTETKCASCSVGGKCTRCANGYFLNFARKCVACPINCGACTSAKTKSCLFCDAGYVVENGECIKCELGSIKTKCQICNAADVCTSCADNYFINSKNKCEACSPNCKKCNSASSSDCNVCNDYYILSDTDKSCVKCGQNNTETSCSTCPKDGKCTTCKDGFYLKDIACTSCMVGCSKCSNGTSCITCKADFKLTLENKCALVFMSCDSFNGLDICMLCFDIVIGLFFIYWFWTLFKKKYIVLKEEGEA